MPIQLLAIDIDGTLALRGAEVSPANVEAVNRASAAGIQVVLATGRRHRTTREVAERFEHPMPLVCLGGALIKDHEDRTLASEALEPADLAELLRISRDHGEALVLQTDPGGPGACDFLVDTEVSWNAHVGRYFESHAEHAGRLEPGDLPGDVLVASAFGGAASMAALEATIRARLPRLATVIVEIEGGCYLEVAGARVDKWSGLKQLAAYLGIARDAIAAIGDQLNDIPMLENAALAIAMGNGHEEVRRRADLITAPHDEDGVARAIEWLLGNRPG